MNIIIAFIASAAFVGSAYAACDNTTAAKAEMCVFKSDLFNPSKLPKTLDEINGYCSANATNNCLATMMGECNDDERQTNLMKSLVTPERVLAGQMYLCDNKTELEGNIDCPEQDFAAQAFQDCLAAAVGLRTNAGPEVELKKRLDDMCTFFDAYAKCFEGDGITETCKMVVKNSYMMAVNGISYAYCGLDDAGKKSVVDAYTVGSSSVLAASLVTVFTAFLLSVFY